MKKLNRRLTVAILAAATCMAAYGDNDDFAYKQTNLLSDGFVSAATIDKNLVNPWGMTAFPGAPFWIADNGAGVSTL